MDDTRTESEHCFAPSPFAHVILTNDRGVILDLRHDTFLGLNSMARQIWMHIVEGNTPLETASLLATRYEVEPAQLLADVLKCVQVLHARELLQYCDEGRLAAHSSGETITLSGWEPDEALPLPREIRDIQAWQRPQQREAFATLLRIDELLKQVGLQTLAHALMDVPAHRVASAEDAGLREGMQAVMEASEWLPFHAACLHQYLALAWMLRRRHIHVEMVLGMYTHPFSAHVWLESQGKLLQWQAGMGYSSDVRRVEAMSVIFHTGKLATQAKEQQP